MPRRLRWIVLLALVGLIAGACGDSGGGDGGGDDGGATLPAVTSGGDSDDTLITLGTLLGNIPGIDDDCIAIANVFGALTNVSLALSGQGNFDADDAQALFDDAADLLPGDLQDDVQVMAEGLIAFFQAVSDAGIDFNDPTAVPSAAQLAQLESAAEAIDSDEFNAASDALTAYAEEQCDEFAG